MEFLFILSVFVGESDRSMDWLVPLDSGREMVNSVSVSLFPRLTLKGPWMR